MDLEVVHVEELKSSRLNAVLHLAISQAETSRHHRQLALLQDADAQTEAQLQEDVLNN